MGSRWWQRGAVCALAILLGVVLAACGGAGGDARGGDGGFSNEVVAQQVEIAADPSGALRWDRATYEATAGDISFVVKNPSPIAHQFTLEGPGVNRRSKNFGANTTNTFTVKALPAGEYRIICDYPGHKAAGMVATLVVR